MFNNKNKETVSQIADNLLKSKIICMLPLPDKYKRQVAFTLAEVLLTLLIIGIVASIVIPNLIQDTRNAELNTAWKKAYGAATQAYNLAIITNGSNFGKYSCSDWGTNDPLLKYNGIKNQLRIIKECNGSTFGNCWAKEGITPYAPSGGCGGFQKFKQNETLAFVTADGMSWLLYGYNPESYYCSLIAIDVNGLKPPNQWGKDTFSFGIDDKKLIPDQCDPTHTHSSLYVLEQ